MAKSVKLRQGTAAEHAGFTGQMAEVTFDTTNNTVILHDGATAGGIPMAKLSDVPVDLTDLTDVDGNITVALGGTVFSGTTYVVTVGMGTNGYGSGSKYFITDLVGASPTVTLTEGVTYRFNQSDSTNTGHPLKFSITPDGTHDSGIEYTTGVTYNGVPGQEGAYTEIAVEVGAPTLYYYCVNHSGMGLYVPPAPAGPTPIFSLYGDSSSFAATTTAKVDTNNSGYTSRGGYTALNHPLDWGNTWMQVDGSYVLRNNSEQKSNPTIAPFHIYSTDDLSEGMTYQFYMKIHSSQPSFWNEVGAIETVMMNTYPKTYNYYHWMIDANQLGWGANGLFGYYSNGATSLADSGWVHLAVEVQSNGRLVHYLNGQVVVNVDASDLSTLTEKANFYLGSVRSYITDIEIYTGGGIHNPDLLATPPGFTPTARKTY
jgi:hypothetical protein